jgi:DNA-binding XRE family transcriptional regulator
MVNLDCEIELKAFRSHLKILRSERGMTQERLAQEAGFHRTTITKIEKGYKNPSLPALIRIARALRVDMGTLMDYRYLLD